jgi:SAM-dependent methyltransferase
MDIWSRLYLDFWRGEVQSFSLERDDGKIHMVPSAEGFFTAPRTDVERAAMDGLQGRVLELGCGVGSHALYLQGRGVDVTAVDSSPGAIEICRERGCREALVMDIRDLPFAPGSFDHVVCMGNTLGIGQSPDSFPSFLGQLRGLVGPGGTLVAALVDPLATDDPDHLEYHDRNRALGLPPGMIRTRMAYRGEVSEWWELWMPTSDELRKMAKDAGWSDMRVKGEGADRVVTLIAG